MVWDMPPTGRSTAEKVRENRLRRVAVRRRLRLEKSRIRDPWGWDFGVYWLYRRMGSGQWPGWDLVTPRDGVSLDEIERFLKDYRPRQAENEVREASGVTDSGSRPETVGPAPTSQYGAG